MSCSIEIAFNPLTLSVLSKAYLKMKNAASALDTFVRVSFRLLAVQKPVRTKKVSIKICGIFEIAETQ